MRFVVTGGAGFIGSHIVDSLAGLGNDVIIFDNFISGRKENIAHLKENKKIKVIHGSITDLAILRAACESADGIFHEAAIASVQQSLQNPLRTHETNATGTLNVLLAARDAGVKKIVSASSAAVYGDNPILPKHEEMIPEPLSPYAVSKITGEYYCSVFSRLYGLKTVSLRYFNVYGPRQDPRSEYSGVISKFIMQAILGKPITIYGDGEQTRDFIFIDDVVTANIHAMERDVQGIFNIASGRETSLNKLEELVTSVSGTKVPVIYEPPRSGDIRKSLADISRARKRLGFEPEYTITKGLEHTISALR
ncbi:MAG: SDR family oxidoreductase [Methanospirillum sp.]|uniref:SDR family oxidoreductase n=1 Tax=Methanospirillum sp. TaxID=45200 RepID=UPI002371B0AA|nr:SDR family oxidoreductase [Methanospirillum sp.]MDD1728252.1 SDR family oxidoreductase [Methanospirillum sp.]